MTAPGHQRSIVDGTEVDARAAAFVSAGTIPHVIEGERRRPRAGRERPIMNPSTGNQIGVVADGDADDRGAVIEAIMMLERSERDVIVMRLLRGYSFREIASSLEVTEAAAKMRFQRALAALRRDLEQQGIAP